MARVAWAAEVPAPFTAIKANAKEFRCLGRRTELGDLLLPTQIVAADGKLLAAPVRLVIEAEGGETNSDSALRSARPTLVENKGDSARWEWRGESTDLAMRSNLRADCDGFCWYEIRLEPKFPTRLRRLTLEIPRTRSTAKYLHTASYDWSNVSQGLPELGGHWAGKFLPYVWLGDEDRGLAWCAESDQGWNLSQPARALSVDTKGEEVLFRATFLDHEEVLKKPLVLRFGLQASPVKPVSFAWRARARILHDIHYDSFHPDANGRCELDAIKDGGAKTVVIHDSWTKYFGQMTPADAVEFRRLIDACHARGLRLLVYVGYGVARNAPELAGEHDEWSVMPLIPWDPGYKPEMRGFDATCARSGWADWLVAGTEKLFSEFDLDGLYFDGTSEAWRCTNARHGCGWTDEKGVVHAVYPMLAARSLMRRMAETVRRHKPNAILDAHMSSNLTLPTLSFCDSLWNGEQFEAHTSAEKFQVPLHAFRTEFMGYAHGMDMEFLCYENRPFTFSEAMALAWVHGVEVRPYPKTLRYVTPVWEAMERFGVVEARWQPYWAGSGASSENANVKVSAWVKKNRALLFVSHLQREKETVRVRLDAGRLGLKKKWQVSDALTNEPITMNGNDVELAFEGMNFRMLDVR